jgi:hypothetical protein
VHHGQKLESNPNRLLRAFAASRLLKGSRHESTGIGEAHLPQLQDHPQEARGARDLQGSTPQAAPGLSSGENYF